jgi:hypothetical protein
MAVPCIDRRGQLGNNGASRGSACSLLYASDIRMVCFIEGDITWKVTGNSTAYVT